MATATKHRALGRGLEALLPSRRQEEAAPETPSVAAGGHALDLPLDAIERNPFQTRTRFDEAQMAELTASVAATGVVQPIVVRRIGERFQLITGERRLMASRRAEKATIPAVIREASDEQAMEMTIVENLQRADLNPMEQARAYQRLGRDFQMTQEQMAARTGKERASVANFLRLLRLPEEVQASVEAGELSFGHARSLLALETPERMKAAAQKVMSLSLSVRQTESYVSGLLHPEGKATKSSAEEKTLDPNVKDAGERLQRRLGLRVQIEDRKGKGRVIIEYANLQDFDTLLAMLEGNG